MRKSKLGLLLRVQFRETMRGSRSAEATDTKRTRRARSANRSYAVMMTIASILIVFVVSFIFLGIAYAVEGRGMERLLILIGVVSSSALSMITSIYQTNGLVFGYKDYDLTMALPFPTSVLVASRVLILYFWNLIFCAAIMVPAGVVYAVFAAPGVSFWPLYIVGLLLTPLIPSVIATLIGLLIAVAASRFPHKGIMGTLFTLLFLVAYLLIVWNMESLIDTVAVFGPQITEAISDAWPPAAWLTNGCCVPDYGSFAIYCAVSVGVFALFCAIVGRYFRHLNSALSAHRGRGNFRMGTQRTRDPRSALLRKELARFTGSSAYMMNAGLGYVLVAVFGILIAVLGPDNVFGTLAEIDESTDPSGELTIHIAPFVAMMLGFFMSMGAPASVSVSLEGNTLWILKTSPVSTSEILRSKRTFNLILVCGSSLIGGTALCVAFRNHPETYGLFYLVLFSYGIFAVMLGQTMNLKYPNLDWTSEVKAVKQSKSVMVCTFVCMGASMVPMMFSMALGSGVAYGACSVLIAVSILLYRHLRTRGVEQFDALLSDG